MSWQHVDATDVVCFTKTKGRARNITVASRIFQVISAGEKGFEIVSPRDLQPSHLRQAGIQSTESALH